MRGGGETAEFKWGERCNKVAEAGFESVPDLLVFPERKAERVWDRGRARGGDGLQGV